MAFISIFNDVLGPVMRGPSSSHTAGSYYIGRLVRSLLGEKPDLVEITFDPEGSYARIYHQQGVDLAFAVGIMELPLTDDRFFSALGEAKKQNIHMSFRISTLQETSHPNSVTVRLTSGAAKELMVSAKSTGGGSVQIDRINSWPVTINGKSFDYFIVSRRRDSKIIQDHLRGWEPRLQIKEQQTSGNDELLWLQSQTGLNKDICSGIAALPEVKDFWWAPPVFFVQQGTPWFEDAAGMVRQAEKNHCSLGEMALKYESQLLGMPESQVLEEVVKRFEIMQITAAEMIGYCLHSASEPRIRIR